MNINWKKKFGGLGMSDIGGIAQLYRQEIFELI
jgi:hypothetical protein